METLNRTLNWMMVVILLAMIMVMNGCSKTDENGVSVGQKVDRAIDATNAKAGETGQKMKDAAAKADDKLQQGAEKARETFKEETAKMEGKSGDIKTVVDDSAITASIKADLLKDPALSALKVEVSTDKGEVTLKGNVKNQADKERAGRLAGAVAGVQKVNNDLQVAAGDAGARWVG